ncbi:hypothetical protein [Streptomyces sp. enrichment culture]|uniref:hypothetical protein n=1 Tax=Streptomyces sp. enrichment culture TaxID=1795815 RepID=UPI003F564235
MADAGAPGTGDGRERRDRAEHEFVAALADGEAAAGVRERADPPGRGRRSGDGRGGPWCRRGAAGRLDGAAALLDGVGDGRPVVPAPMMPACAMTVLLPDNGCRDN